MKAANAKTIVVLISSFPYAITWVQDNVPAILHMAHNSQEEGNALADVLFGDYNPGGRLAATWVKSLNDLPPMMDYDIRKGRTYLYFKGQPLYPFGFGLSYTTFEYANLRTSADSVNRAERSQSAWRSRTPGTAWAMKWCRCTSSTRIPPWSGPSRSCAGSSGSRCSPAKRRLCGCR